MPTRRLSLLGFAAVLVLGACSSSSATPTAATSAPTTGAAPTTSAAPTTAAATTAFPTTPAAATAAANDATITLVSQGIVAQTGGKMLVADATCIATGLLAKYDIAQLAAMQSAPVSSEVVAATAVIVEDCVGPERAAEVGALLAGGAA
jgi:hypothetical protein